MAKYGFRDYRSKLNYLGAAVLKHIDYIEPSKINASGEYEFADQDQDPEDEEPDEYEIADILARDHWDRDQFGIKKSLGYMGY